MDDDNVKTAGRNQEVPGKVHQLVSVIREVRETATTKLAEKRSEGGDILRTHGVRLLDVSIDCVRDDQKTSF
jgi:hypothetical protein